VANEARLRAGRMDVKVLGHENYAALS